MRRWARDLWAFVAVLGLAAAIVGRWRRGQVVLLSGAAAPAIRLLALLIVFVQACTGRLRGGEEPASQGGGSPAPGGQGSGDDEGEASGGAGEAAGAAAGAGGAGEAGAGGASEPAAPIVAGPALDAEFPIKDEAALQVWVGLLHDRGYDASQYKRMTRQLAVLPEGTGPNDPAWDELVRSAESMQDDIVGEPAAAFVARWRAHLEARKAGSAEGAAELLALLDASEALPLYDGWLVAYVWRRAMPVAMSASARAQLLERLERHARVVHALIKAQVEAGPVEFTAWRSKAAPPKGYRAVRIPAGLLAATRQQYATADAGTWESAGTLALTVARGEVELVRRGQTTKVPAGSAVTLRRLDLLRAPGPALLQHPDLGDMSIGAGATVTAWDVGERVDAAGKAKLRARIEAALGGDAKALTRLEASLPAAHAEIRAAVAKRPNAKGAAGLRMLLALFDE